MRKIFIFIENKPIHTVVALLFFHVSVASLMSWVAFSPYFPHLHNGNGLWNFGLDSMIYHWEALELIDFLSDGNWVAWWNFYTKLGHAPVKWIALAYWIFGSENPLLFEFVNSVVWVSSVICMYLAARMLFGKNVILACCATSFLFFPTVLLSTTQLLRDPFYILGFCLLTYGWVTFFHKQFKWQGTIAIVLGFYFTTSIRFYVGPILIAIFFICAVISILRKKIEIFPALIMYLAIFVIQYYPSWSDNKENLFWSSFTNDYEPPKYGVLEGAKIYDSSRLKDVYDRKELLQEIYNQVQVPHFLEGDQPEEKIRKRQFLDKIYDMSGLPEEISERDLLKNIYDEEAVKAVADQKNELMSINELSGCGILEGQVLAVNEQTLVLDFKAGQGLTLGEPLNLIRFGNKVMSSDGAEVIGLQETDFGQVLEITKIGPDFSQAMLLDPTVEVRIGDGVRNSFGKLTFLECYLNKRIAIRFSLMRYGFRIVNTGAGSVIDNDVRFPNIWSMFSYLPRAIQVGLFSPFPGHWISPGVQTGHAGRIVAGLETFMFYLVFSGLCLVLFMKRKIFEPIAPVLISAAVIIILLGFAVPNVGAIYRMRQGLFIPFFLVGVYGLSLLIARVKSTSLKRHLS